MTAAPAFNPGRKVGPHFCHRSCYADHARPADLARDAAEQLGYTPAEEVEYARLLAIAEMFDAPTAGQHQAAQRAAVALFGDPTNPESWAALFAMCDRFTGRRLAAWRESQVAS